MTDVCPRVGCGRPLPEYAAVWCPRCAGLLDGALRELPALWRRLQAELAPGGGRGEPVSGSRSPGVPLRIGLLALAQDLARVACRCEDALRAPQHRPRVYGGRSYHLRGCEAALRHVGGHQGALLGLWGGPAAAEALLGLHGEIVAALRLAPLVNRLPVPCPTCAGGLSRRDGEETVACAGCGRLWRWEDYQWLVRTTVDGMPV